MPHRRLQGPQLCYELPHLICGVVDISCCHVVVYSYHGASHGVHQGVIVGPVTLDGVAADRRPGGKQKIPCIACDTKSISKLFFFDMYMYMMCVKLFKTVLCMYNT